MGRVSTCQKNCNTIDLRGAQVNDSLAELTNTNAVAENLNDYVMQACNRACELKPARAPGMKKPLPWYDEECKSKRAEAIKAGERVENYLDRQNLFEKCQQYRSCKQRKRRNFHSECLKRIEYTYRYDKSNLWSVLNEISRGTGSVIPLTGDELYNHFAALSIPPKLDNVNFEYEAGAVAFLERYSIDGE